MATSAELQRLDGVLTRLTPLAQAARGELIKAENWNAVVTAIIELARAILERSATAGIPAHTHIDEVSIGWLDKQLRTLISGGALKDPIQEGRLNELERKIKQVNSDVAGRKTDVIAVRAELDRITTQELARENSVHNLDRKVEGLGDAREEIGQFKLTLEGISKEIATVQTIANQLRDDDGSIVDVVNMRNRIDDLAAFREQLKDANGEPLTGIIIEQKIAEALNTLVTEDELKDALDQRLDGIEGSLAGDLDRKIGLAVDQRFSSSISDFQNEMNSNLNRSLEGLDAKIMQTVADEVPGLQESIQQNLKIQLESQMADFQQGLSSEIDAKTASLRAELLQSEQALKTELTQEFGQLIIASESKQLTAYNQSLAGLAKEFDTKLQQGLEGLAGTIRTQANQVVAEQLAKGIPLSEASRASLLKELDGIIAQKVAVSSDGTIRTIATSTAVDDFTVLTGVGETYDSRLKEANITSYDQLAKLAPEEVASITRMSLSQVIELDVVGQARKLSGSS